MWDSAGAPVGTVGSLVETTGGKEGTGDPGGAMVGKVLFPVGKGAGGARVEVGVSMGESDGTIEGTGMPV